MPLLMQPIHVSLRHLTFAVLSLVAFSSASMAATAVNVAATTTPAPATNANSMPAATTTTLSPSVQPTSAPATAHQTAPASSAVTSNPANAAPTTEETPAVPPAINSVVLPINAGLQPTIALSVNVPTTFKALPFEQKVPQFSMIEFIPQNETGDNWTQIITTNSFLNKQLPAGDFIQYMQKRFQQDATDATIVNNMLVNYPHYQKACTTIDYHNGTRHEMVYMCYYSGPYDNAGIQYAVLYPQDNPTPADLAKKLQAFVDANVQVLNPETPVSQQ